MQVKVLRVRDPRYTAIYHRPRNRYSIIDLESNQPPPETKDESSFASLILENILVIIIFISVAVGLALGVALRSVWSHDDYRKIHYLEFPGRILLNVLKLLIVPLVTSSLITVLSSIGTEASGRLGAAASVYYFLTTVLAVIVGCFLVLIVKPGSTTQHQSVSNSKHSQSAGPLDTVIDIISQCFPENLVTATFERVVTSYVYVQSDPRRNEGDNTTYSVMISKPLLETVKGTNVLGLVVTSILIGCVIKFLKEDGAPMKEFFLSVNNVTMSVIHIVIWYAPVGMVFLIASKCVSVKNVETTLKNLGRYFAVVIGGLAIHGLLDLPILYFICTRKNPWSFALNMSKALCTAWGTASSSAALPITMECLVNNNNININVARFLAPVGATFNMDGTVLYEAVTGIFIAQLNGRELSAVDVIIISLLSMAAGVGASALPQSGMVTMVIVLTAVGLPADDVSIVMSVDWILDRFRTTINVWGDCIGAGILNSLFEDMLVEENKQTTTKVAEEEPEVASAGSVSSLGSVSVVSASEELD